MEIKDKIQELKRLRLKPEERFLVDIFNQLKPKISDENPNSLYYVLNDKILFEYESKSGNFWCHSNVIWSILSMEYLLDQRKIDELFNNIVLKYINLNIINPTTKLSDIKGIHALWGEIILKDITTV